MAMQKKMMKNKPNKQTTDNRNLHLKFECENEKQKWKLERKKKLCQPTNQPTEKQIRVKRKNRTAIELNSNHKNTEIFFTPKRMDVFQNNDGMWK